MNKFSYCFILFLSFFCSSLSFAGQPEVLRTVLDNGLIVLIQEVPGSEVVALDACVKTGSALESRWLGKGVSHFVEHMLFKGTVKRPVGAIAKEVKSLGGVINASTGNDYTVYTLDLPNHLFGQGLDIISDMLMHSVFDVNETEKERKVIQGEMALYNDRPDRMLSDLVFRNVYKQHPYKHPTIGYPVLFDSISHEELVAYYKERYIPNNMILSIAGSVKASVILPLIQEAFSSFKPAAYLDRNLPQEPEQTHQRYAEKEYPTNLIRFSLAYQGVSVVDPDLYALDVLSMALGQGGSSRLFKEVYKNQRLVEGISAVNYTPQDRGVFEILGSMTKDRLKEVLVATERIIKDIQHKGLEQSELDKTKRQVLAGFIFGNQTASSLASRAVVDEVVAGDSDFSRHYVELVKKVNNEDIKRVAKRYLQASRLSISVLKPKVERAAEVNERTDHPEAIKKFVLDNGLTILLREDPSVSLASIKWVMNGGIRFEDSKLGGLAGLTGAVWATGTKRLSEDQIHAAIEQRGGSLGSGGSYSSMGINIDVLSEDLDFALNLLEDVVKNPSFSVSVINRHREDMLTSLESRKDDIMAFSSRALMETLYQQHPLRKDPLGTKESLAQITQADILKFYHQFLVGGNVVISVFGNFNSDQVLNLLKKKFGSLDKGEIKIPLFKENPPSATRVNELHMDKKQGLLLMAFQAPSMKESDRFGMEIISNYLGGGLGGRLFVKVREELGQAYTTSARYSVDIDTGTFVLYVLTTPEKIDSVKQVVIKELENLKTQDLTVAELETVKSYLKGGKVRSLLTNSSLAATASSDELYGLGYDFYQKFNSQMDAVTIADIRRIANLYLDLSKAALVITTPKEPGTQNHE